MQPSLGAAFSAISTNTNFRENHEYKMFACICILGSLRTNKIGNLSTERSYQSKMVVDFGKMFVNFYECLRPLVIFDEGFRKRKLDTVGNIFV